MGKDQTAGVGTCTQRKTYRDTGRKPNKHGIPAPRILVKRQARWLRRQEQGPQTD